MSSRSDDDRERWNARYAEARPSAGGGSAWPTVFKRLTDHAGLGGAGLGRAGGGSRSMAIDLAGGDGRGAIGMADLGLIPVLVDVSDVALALAAERATAAGVTLRTHRMDLTGVALADVLAAVNPEGVEVAVVSCVHYLNRDLLRSVSAGLPSGAVFMASIATTTNLERNERPSARFLVSPGELRSLVAHGPALQVLHDTEGWNEDGAHEAELIVTAL